MLRPSTIRDWSGGWNVADNDKNLSAKFMVEADNIDIDIDNALGVRYGTKLYKKLKDGTATTSTGVSVDVKTTVSVGQEGIVTIGHTGHGFSSGDHVTFSNLTAAGGISASELNRTHGIVKIDDDNYKFCVRESASSAVTSNQSANFVHDDHTISGQTLGGVPFNNNVYVFSANGEVAKIDSSGVVTKLWDYNICNGIHGTALYPWRWSTHIDFDYYKRMAVIVNGWDKDKPLQIDPYATNEVDFYIDPGVGSNTFIPRADYVQASNGYLILASTDLDDGSGNRIGQTYLSFNDVDALGVYAGAAPPDRDWE